MAAKVSFSGGITAISLDWQEVVNEPANAGYFVEAFARGDALIDELGNMLLRNHYNSHDCQDLINQIIKVRPAALNGLAKFQVLKNKGLIKKELFSQIEAFKKARNRVLHTLEGEYGLIDHINEQPIKDQEMFDTLTKEKALSHLRDGSLVFYSLVSTLDLPIKNPDKPV